ncbi:MAG: alpha/beta hydrolase family protein [Candidatus Sumerlaeaceae bacterium]
MLSCLLGWGASSGAAPHAQAEDVLQSQREVTFPGANGVKLAGTLLVPARRSDAEVPGVIIVAGSGPTDRDGNSALLDVKINLLKQIAEQLAQEGVASLRYDKRGQYASEKAPEDQEALSAFTLWENYVGDAAAALAYLQKQNEINVSRTAMVGHSEGGMLILQAAVEGKGFQKPPAALVLVSTPGRPADVILREQLARDPFAWFFLKQNDAIMEVIKKTGRVPNDVPAVLAGLYPPESGKFAQSLLSFGGPAWASRFPGPVLVIAGEKDLQHKVGLETAALSAGLKKRHPDYHEVYIVPNASHNLKRVKSDYDHGFTGELAPEASAKLRFWLARKFASTEKK